MARRRGRGRARKAADRATPLTTEKTEVPVSADQELFRSLGERLVAKTILELAIIALFAKEIEGKGIKMAAGGGGGWMAGIGRNLMGLLGGTQGDCDAQEQPKSGCKTPKADQGRSKGQQRRTKRRQGGSGVVQERKNERHSAAMQNDTSPNKRKSTHTSAKTVVGPSANKAHESRSHKNGDAKTRNEPPVLKNGGTKNDIKPIEINREKHCDKSRDLGKLEHGRDDTRRELQDDKIKSGSELAELSQLSAKKGEEETGRDDGNSSPRSPTTDPRQIPIERSKEEVSVDRSSGFQTTGKEEEGEEVVVRKGGEKEEKKPHGSLETVTGDCAAAQNEQLAVLPGTAVDEGSSKTLVNSGDCDNNDDTINSSAMIVGSPGPGCKWAGRLSHAACNIEIPEGRKTGGGEEERSDLDAVSPNYGPEVQISACRTELLQLQQTEEKEERSPSSPSSCSSPSTSSYRRANNKVDMPAERSETELDKKGGGSESQLSSSSESSDDASEDEIWEEDLNSTSEEENMDLPPPLPPKLPARGTKGSVPPPPPPPPQSYRKMVEDSLRHHKQSEDLLKDFMAPQKKSGRKSSRKEHRRRTSEKRLPSDDQAPFVPESPEPSSTTLNSTQKVSVSTTPDSERKRKKSKKNRRSSVTSSPMVDDACVKDDLSRSPLRDTPPTPPVLGRKHYKLQKTDSTRSQSSLSEPVHVKNDLAKSKSTSQVGSDNKKSGRSDDQKGKQIKDARRKSEARLEHEIVEKVSLKSLDDGEDCDGNEYKREVLSLDNAHTKFDRKYGGEMGAFRKSLREQEEIVGEQDGVRLREERRKEANSSAATTKNYSSRRSSTDSSEDGFNLNIRDLKNELKEVEEKFRKAMVANAGLDNEKQQLTYQVDLLKDRLEESEEQSALVTKELREKNRDFELLKRSYAEAQRAVQLLQAQMDEQARLLAERGMVLVGGADEDGEEGAAPNGHTANGVAEVDAEEQEARTRAIVSSETAAILSGLGPGPLDVRIKRLADDRDDLQDSLRRLKMDLEEEKTRSQRLERSPFTEEEADWETKKIIDDYKFKMQKAEQDINTLQTNVHRLESQVVRYKTAAETAERSEEELKTERRKIQRELREATTRVEELETANKHLETRLGKLKTAKSNLLKDL